MKKIIVNSFIIFVLIVFSGCASKIKLIHDENGNLHSNVNYRTIRSNIYNDDVRIFLYCQNYDVHEFKDQENNHLIALCVDNKTNEVMNFFDLKSGLVEKLSLNKDEIKNLVPIKNEMIVTTTFDNDYRDYDVQRSGISKDFILFDFKNRLFLMVIPTTVIYNNQPKWEGKFRLYNPTLHISVYRSKRQSFEQWLSDILNNGRYFNIDERKKISNNICMNDKVLYSIDPNKLYNTPILKNCLLNKIYREKYSNLNSNNIDKALKEVFIYKNIELGRNQKTKLVNKYYNLTVKKVADIPTFINKMKKLHADSFIDYYKFLKLPDFTKNLSYANFLNSIQYKYVLKNIDIKADVIHYEREAGIEIHPKSSNLNIEFVKNMNCKTLYTKKQNDMCSLFDGSTCVYTYARQKCSISDQDEFHERLKKILTALHIEDTKVDTSSIYKWKFINKVSLLKSKNLDNPKLHKQCNKMYKYLQKVCDAMPYGKVTRLEEQKGRCNSFKESAYSKCYRGDVLGAETDASGAICSTIPSDTQSYENCTLKKSDKIKNMFFQGF